MTAEPRRNYNRVMNNKFTAVPPVIRDNAGIIRAASKALLVCAALVALFSALPALLIVRLGDIAGLLGAGDAVVNALDGLKDAEISPPAALAVLCAVICGLTAYTGFISEKRGIKICCFIALPIAALLSSALCVYFTRVNGVPLHTAAGIVADILRSGII